MSDNWIDSLDHFMTTDAGRTAARMAAKERDELLLKLHKLSEDHSHCEDDKHELGRRASDAESKLRSVEAERDAAKECERERDELRGLVASPAVCQKHGWRGSPCALCERDDALRRLGAIRKKCEDEQNPSPRHGRLDATDRGRVDFALTILDLLDEAPAVEKRKPLRVTEIEQDGDEILYHLSDGRCAVNHVPLLPADGARYIIGDVCAECGAARGTQHEPECEWRESE